MISCRFILNVKNLNHIVIMIFVLFSCIGFVHAQSSKALDEQIIEMSQQPKHLKTGQALFDTVCAACHKKDLSGAMGFNLKDGEWVHGSKPSQILNNIKTGFAEAGMPAFGSMYSTLQLKQIAAYVLSKREGWDNLTYKIYQLPASKTRDFSQIEGETPVKSGQAFNNLADLTMPESKEFAAVYEGDFYNFKEFDTLLFAPAPQMLVDVYIDGKKVEPASGWQRYWPLKRGKQHLKIKIMTPPLPFPKWTNTNLSLMVTNADKTIKYFPLTTRAHQALSGTNFEVKATDKTLVQRKVVVDLPVYSIAVGLPQKLNYGFNTKSCAIVGLWQGELLNIGPNIKGRGQDASVPLGDWLFSYPQQLKPESECEYIKYSRLGHTKLEFMLDKVRLSLTAVAQSNQEINFEYQVLANPEQVKTLSFKLPDSEKINFTISAGKIDNGSLTLDIKKNRQFNVSVQVVGD